MRIQKLFSSVLAGLALMYASGCNDCSQQVAGYNVYGYPAGVTTQAVVYDPAYGQGLTLAPPPLAVTEAYRQPRYQRAKARRGRARYARPTKQRFVRVAPAPQGYLTQPAVTANFGPNYPGTATLLTDPSFVPTITTNANAGTVSYEPAVTSTVLPAGTVPAPIPAPVLGQLPPGAKVEYRTVYRRGRPVRQRRTRQVQYVMPAPAPIYSAPGVTYAPSEPVQSYVPSTEPLPEPAPAPAEPYVATENLPEITSEPIVSTVVESQTVSASPEPVPVVQQPASQPVMQPIVQPVIIQPIIQPVIQAPVQQSYAEPVQMPAPEPVMQPAPAPVYEAPAPAPVFSSVPAPVFPGSGFEAGVLGSSYCPPDICPTPNPVVCAPGQNLSECFTLNDYQIQNSPTQIFTPTATGPLPIAVNMPAGSVLTSNPDGTITAAAGSGQGFAPSKYETLTQTPTSPADFGRPQVSVPTPIGQTDNIPPVPAASEIENALDAMLSRDHGTPNLK